MRGLGRADVRRRRDRQAVDLAVEACEPPAEYTLTGPEDEQNLADAHRFAGDPEARLGPPPGIGSERHLFDPSLHLCTKRYSIRMKAVLAIAAVCVLGAAALAYFVLDPFGDDSDPTASLHLSGTACERLAGLAGYLADTDDNVNEFLLDLGQRAGGISRGRRALADLARGGRNRIPGKGFKQRFDDGSIGQVRHFVGYARASMFGGTNVTRWISENLRHDAAGFPGWPAGR